MTHKSKAYKTPRSKSDRRSGRDRRTGEDRRTGKDRKDGSEGGGVCFLIHSSISVSPMKLPEKYRNLEVVIVDLVSSDSKQRVVCVYRPPGRLRETEIAEAKLLSECMNLVSDAACPVTVVGDLNLPNLDWDSLNCPNDGVHDTLLDSFLGNSMQQFVREPTREGNLLDLVLCTDESNVSGVSVIDPFCSSDHNSVKFQLVSCVCKDNLRNVRDWKHADYAGIANFLNGQNWENLFSMSAEMGEDRVNDYYNAFLSVIDACIEFYVPLRRCKKGFARKLPRKLRKLRARKKRLYRLRNLVPNGRRLYKECSDEFNRAVKGYAEKLENKFIIDGNVRKFYSFANSKLKSRNGVSPLQTGNGATTVNDREKCDILNNFFCGVFTADDNSRPDFDKIPPENVNLKNIVFTPSKVCKILKKNSRIRRQVAQIMFRPCF